MTQFGHCTAVALPRVVATKKGHSNRGYSLSALRTLRAMQKASASEAAQSGKRDKQRQRVFGKHTYLEKYYNLGGANECTQAKGRAEGHKTNS